MNRNNLINQIIEENRLSARKKADPHSCPCYNGTRCHNSSSDYEMICLLCICPEYNQSTEEGRCKINQPKGKWFYHKNLPTGRIWDCSDCGLPHTEKYVRDYLERLSLEELETIRECKTINDLWKFFDRND